MSEIELPSNLDAERLTLGAILCDPSQFPLVLSVLAPGDFHFAFHQQVFRSLARLNLRGEKLNHVTLAAELGKAIEGHIADLASLTEGMPELTNLDSFCDIVRKNSVLRQAIRGAQNLIERCGLGINGPAEVLPEAQALVELLNRTGQRSAVQTPHEIIGAAGGLDSFFKPDRSRGIATPFEALNNTIHLLEPQQLVVVAARPSVGKSAFVMQVAVHAALKQRKRTLVYSLEMSSVSLLRRAIIAHSQVSGMKVRTGQLLSTDEFLRLKRTVEQFRQIEDERYLLISEDALVTTNLIDAELERLKAQGFPVDLVVFDMIQLGSAIGRFENTVQRITAISRGLKLMAKKHDISVLAVSSLNRAVETRDGRRPQLSDLRESGAIESDADTVIFLWPTQLVEDPDATVRKVSWAVAKQREGPLNEGVLYFQRKLTRFEESMEEDHAVKALDLDYQNA